MTSVQVDRRNLVSAELVSVKDYGAAGNGTTDDTAAFQAAVDSGTRAIFIPDGSYKLTSAITLPSNISVFGAGPAATKLLPSTASMTVFSHSEAEGGVLSSAMADIQLSDFSIDAVAFTGVTGISFTNSDGTAIDRVWFYGCATNVVIDRGFAHAIRDCLSAGSVSICSGQLKLWSSSNSDYVFDVTVTDYKIRATMAGRTWGSATPAIYVRRGVSVFLNKCISDHLQYGTNAGSITHIQLENDCQGCKLSHTVSNGAAIGILFQYGTGPSSGPSFSTIHEADVDQFTTAGIKLIGTNVLWNSISGGKITAPGGATIPCVQLDSCGGLEISGVVILQTSTQNGIGFDFTAANIIHIKNCLLYNLSKGFNFNGSSNTQIHVRGCDLQGSAAAVSGTIDTGSGSTFNSFMDNRGVNPGTVSTPSVPSSTTAYTNSSGYPLRIFITSGTVTVVKINGTTTNLTTGHPFFIDPGETIAITYSVVPTWVFVGR